MIRETNREHLHQRIDHRERGDRLGYDSVAQLPAADPQGSRRHMRPDSVKAPETHPRACQGGWKHEGSCPEPEIMMVLSPRAAWEPCSNTGKPAQAGNTFQICAALAKSSLAGYRLCDGPSQESLNRKEGEEPAAPVGTGYWGVERVGQSWRESHVGNLLQA